MKNTLSKITIDLILALARLVAVPLNNVACLPKPSLFEHSGALSGDHAARYVVPSGDTATICVLCGGHLIGGWTLSIFGFQRASCNEAVGWILRERITVTE